MEPNMMPGGNQTDRNAAPAASPAQGAPNAERVNFDNPATNFGGGNMNMEPEEKSVGPIVGSIIVIVIIILGGLYFSGAKLAKYTQTPEEILGDTTVTEELRSQSASDEVVDIEADLEASDFSDIDTDLSDIESQL